jgi:5'-3' exonuclease
MFGVTLSPNNGDPKKVFKKPEIMQVEVIFNVLEQVFTFVRHLQPEHIVFTWDSRRSYRRDRYPDYKGNRPSRHELTEEERWLLDISYIQFGELRRRVLPELGFKNNFISTGLEADDLIASITQNQKNAEKQIVIVSSDKDLFQLLGPNISMFNPFTKRMTTNKSFTKEYGIPPEKWGLVKAVGGCASDNVAGINGIGEKTAIKWIRGLLPSHYKKYHSIVSNDGKAIIKRNKALVVLPFEGTPIIDIKDDVLYQSDFLKVFQKYNFRSFLKTDVFLKWERVFKLR